MKSTAWVFSWSALCRSARMRISAAFSTDRLLHSASSHITFRRSRAYCKIQAEVQLQRRENTSSGLTWSLTCAPSLFSNKLLYYAEQTSLLCYMHLNCTQRSSDQQKKKKKRRIMMCPPWGKQWRGNIPTITHPGLLVLQAYSCCVHALKWDFQVTCNTISVTSRHRTLQLNLYSHSITAWQYYLGSVGRPI